MTQRCGNCRWFIREGKDGRCLCPLPVPRPAEGEPMRRLAYATLDVVKRSQGQDCAAWVKRQPVGK